MSIQLPGSAADLPRTLRAGQVEAGIAPDAYIRNPIADRAILTPVEALAAIGILAATLESDERYRAELASRKADLPAGGGA